MNQLYTIENIYQTLLIYVKAELLQTEVSGTRWQNVIAASKRNRVCDEGL